MPLLGVHEVVFAPVTEEQAQGALRLAKLSFEIFLSSFQVPKRGAGATPFEFRPSYSEISRVRVILWCSPEWAAKMGFFSFILHFRPDWGSREKAGDPEAPAVLPPG